MRNIALLYHDIVPEGQFAASGFQSPDADIYKLSCGEFDHHLQEIQRLGAPVPSSILANNDGAKIRLMLTFDDGGASAFVETSKRLAKFGWCGHFFVTTDMIGKPGFLDEDQIRSLHVNGHVIGSHTCSHPARISHCSSEQLDYEWEQSTRILAGILGEPVTTASVPAGYYSRCVAESAARAGVRVLFTSEPITSSHIVNGCTVIGRFGVQQGTSADWVVAIVSGRIVPRVQRLLFWNSKKLLKSVGGNLWLSLRRRVLAARAGRGQA